MTATPSSVGSFVLRTFLWLPPCFGVWYLVAQYHAAVAGAVARVLVVLFKSGIVSSLERHGAGLIFVTTLEAHPTPGQTAVLAPEVDPLLYTYGLALFLALMLGSRARWWKILAGVCVLLPFQAWGIAFDFLAQVGVTMGAGVSAQAGLLGWRAEVIVLSYQIGSLIFPVLVPVVAWGAFNRPFIGSLVRSRRADFLPVP